MNVSHRRVEAAVFIGRGFMTADRNIQIREATTSADDESIFALNLEYLTWATAQLVEKYGISWPVDAGEVRKMLAKFKRPEGAIFLAEVDGKPVGVVAIRTLNGSVLEIKRMYVRPAWRGAHIGSALIDCALREASELGAVKVRLDTNRFMTDAQRLYRSRGFSECAPYEGTEIPAEFHKYWLFFEKDVVDTGS